MKFYNSLPAFVILFFSLICNFSFAQKTNVKQQEDFYKRYQDYILNQSKGFEVGKDLLKLAQNPYEISIAYFTIGNTHLENGDFVESVKFLQKSYDQASSVDSVDLQLDVLSYLVPAYRRAGLIYQSDENFLLLKKVAEKAPEYKRKLFTTFAEAKIADIDKDYCKSAKLRKEFLKHLQPVSPTREFNLRYEFSVLNQLCYVQYKCGLMEDSNTTLTRIDKIYSELDKTHPIKLVEFYYMNKALLLHGKGDKIEAKKYFVKATDQALKNSSRMVIRDIINERINANIDSDEDKIKLNKIVNDIISHQTSVTKILVQQETENYISEINNKEYKTKVISLGSILFIASLVGGFVWYYNREKKLKLKYIQIINNLENDIDLTSQETKSQNNSNVKNTELDELNEGVDVIKNDKTEKDILSQLEKFEKKKLYNTKSISLAQMAVLLNTNTKYLSYILKKHRNSDFHGYINDKRITNIVAELYQNKKLLNYKIASIAESAGYTSHSQFGSIFKEKMGISPSKFIEFIKKSKNN